LAGELNASNGQDARRTLRAVERLLTAEGYVATAFGTAHPPLEEPPQAADLPESHPPSRETDLARRRKQRRAATPGSDDRAHTPE
jgi:hypothetical protein